MRNPENASPKQRSTAAGRLLEGLTADGAITLRALATALQVSEGRLAECRDGKGRLDPAEQLKLANLAPAISPRLLTSARRLHDQARAALQYETEGAATRHASYPRERFR